MELYYWRSPQGNVGDDLNAWLWPQVLGADFFHPGDARTFFGIGSIFDERVERSPGRSVIFGSGLRRAGRYRPRADLLDIRFVRGPRSVQALADGGLTGVRYIADPAILTPRFCDPAAVSRVPGRIGFIPYFSTPSALSQGIAEATGMTLIPITLEVEDFLTRLRSCEYVVTEAMHGAILADAFRIPWVSCRLLSGVTEGRTSLFKWADWADALGIRHTMANALPDTMLWAPGRIRQRLAPLATARALHTVRAVLKRGDWTLSDEARLCAAQDAILHEASVFARQEQREAT